MNVAVLGGTGFIGQFVVQNLLEHGHAVVALARSEEKAAALRSMGAEPRLGDLRSGEGLGDAVADAEVVVNVAFPSFLGRMTMRRMRRDAREGLRQLRNLVKVIMDRGGGIPLLLTEGTMALGDSGGGWLDETSPYTFDRGHGRLLYLSSPYAHRAAAEMGLRIMILSISGAYGPGSWFAESLYAYIRRGRGMVVGEGSNIWSFVHVTDVAEAYRLMIEKRPIGETVTVADDQPLRYVDFANTVADQLHCPHARRMPVWLARMLLGRVLCEALTMNQRVRNAKAKQLLGWYPAYPCVDEGIAATLEVLGGQ